MTDDLKICPFMSRSDKMVHCIKEQCRAYRKLCEDKYETTVDGNFKVTTIVRGICLLIPGDDCR
ncbi:MAG: hypothetical protein GXY48_12280 [Methanomicrobiales archaeon]|nr:hypothetical protein [Methanomicrobiales archaeon]